MRAQNATLTARSYLFVSANNFRLKFAVLAGALVFVFMSVFQYVPINIDNNIDGSWMYTINSLRQDNSVQLGRDVFYTYGPLLKIIPNNVLPQDGLGNYALGLIIVLILTIGSIFVAYRGISLYGLRKSRYLLPILGALAWVYAICFAQLDTLFFILLTLYGLTMLAESKESWFFAEFSIISLFSLYKLSFSIGLFFIVAIIFFVKLVHNFKDWQSTLFRLLSCIVIYSLLFSICAQLAPQHIFRYLTIGFMNSSAYSEFMGLSVQLDLGAVVLFYGVYVLSFFATLFLLVAARTKDMYAYGRILIIYLPIFLILKWVVVRSSEMRLSNFFIFIPILMTIPFIVLFSLHNYKVRPKYKNVLTFGIILLSLFAVTYVIYSSYDLAKLKGQIKVIMRVNKYAILHNPLNFIAYRDAGAKTRIAIENRKVPVDGLNNYLMSQSESRYLLYGNTTSIAASLDAAVKPSLFIQNYAAFPNAFFDEQYIAQLDSAIGERVILEEVEPSVNERIPSHELNQTFQKLRTQYVAKYANPTELTFVLERVGTGMLHCEMLAESTIKMSDSISVPQIDLQPSEFINMRLTSQGESIDRIVSQIFKSPLYQIRLYNERGVQENRTNLSLLKHGITVRPFYTRYTDVYQGTGFNPDTIVINGGVNKTARIDVTFDKCTYK